MSIPTQPHPIVVRTECCIVGGGPAGMVLGFLLARAGVKVLVLEKHWDFLRDFRGDTVHPSTLEVMYELGLLDDLLKRPHQKTTVIRGQFGHAEFTLADFTHLPTHCQYIVLMPQWDFLDFLSQYARQYPSFQLRMTTEAIGLIEENGQVVGVRAKTLDGQLEVRAPLTVGADGRRSTVRTAAGLRVHNIGAPMDVLWMRLSRHPTDPVDPMGRFESGRIFIMINRTDYWQCGFVIPKGGFDAVRGRGIGTFRDEIAAIAPFVRDRVGELQSWDDVRLLTVAVDRLQKWSRPGLLCIGDAAHAMSPVGGVGINLAIQDAVAAANLLAVPLRDGTLTTDHLRQVQKRRQLPTRLTQWAQVQVQNRVIGRVIGGQDMSTPPLLIRLLKAYPVLQRIPARLIGIGARPEHVRSPVAPVAETTKTNGTIAARLGRMAQ